MKMTKLHKNKEYLDRGWTVSKVNQEINDGLELLSEINKPIVTFFGSRHPLQGSKPYEHCKNLASELGNRGYAIMSGGGPGIMYAANAGAMKAGAPSIGLQARLLPGEKVIDKIFTHKMEFHFFFARRFLMHIKSEALIFYPGGIGTLNELFEYSMLANADIVDRVPIICVGSKYWAGLFKWLKENSTKKEYFVQNSALKLLSIADDLQGVLKIIEG